MIRKRSGGNVDRSIVGFVFEKENATVSRAGAARNGTERNGTRVDGRQTTDARSRRMETTEARRESDEEEEDFGEFLTPAGAVMTPQAVTTTGVDGLETVEAKDDDDDDDTFGEFSTPATTMRGIRFEEENPVTPQPTTITEKPIEAEMVEEQAAARGGELDLCATRDEEFVDAVRKLLRLQDADGSDDGDAYVKIVMDELNAGNATGALMKPAEWEEYARRLELERSVPDKGLRVEVESVSTVEPVPEKVERDLVAEVTPVAEPGPQLDLISLSLENTEPSVPSAVAVDPFANFGALTIESPAKSVEVEPIMDDDDFGDFV